jgi:UDP-N-acetylglucosamine--N-acetylmuramyl-(pentapeptide) pyrophosphoryl-undecaprenol N-acetylglucosamine transferase
MTNKALARLSKKILQAFPGTWPATLRPETCGNPVRATVAELPAPASRMAGRHGAIRILITGGSQGARALNQNVPAALGRLASGAEFAIRHQAGRGSADQTAAVYRSHGLDADVVEFIDDMAGAYGWADIAVCRAGALTVSELAAAGIASVLVPFPHAVDDHQTRNAEFLVEAGAALLLPESGLDAESLAEALVPLIGSRETLVSMAEKARSVSVPDAAERVAVLCREYLPA